jgi:hypothetical protein
MKWIIRLFVNFFCGLGPSPWATPPTLFFVMDFFLDRVSQTIFLGWLWTTMLLISVSWVAGITGVSHWLLAICHVSFLHVDIYCYELSVLLLLFLISVGMLRFKKCLNSLWFVQKCIVKSWICKTSEVSFIVEFYFCSIVVRKDTRCNVDLGGICS